MLHLISSEESQLLLERIDNKFSADGTLLIGAHHAVITEESWS